MKTLLDLLDNAARGPHGLVVIDAPDGEHRLAWSALRARALARLAVLRETGVRRGDAIVLLYEAPDAFLVDFWASLYGGFIAVPLTPPSRPDDAARVTRIVALFRHGPAFWFASDLGLTMPRMLPTAASISGEGTTDEPHSATPDETAFIQLSSGSTGDPKGIVLTHANVLANVIDIAQRSRMTPDDKTLLWMPLTHDMGLVGSHLAPLVVGFEQLVMRPRTFVTRPAAWLSAASHQRATLLTSPSLGLRHVLKHLDSAELARLDLDLDAVRLLYLGADPLDPSIIGAFFDRLAPTGLRREAAYPVYGLAEASVAVTFPEPGSGLRTVAVDRHSLQPGTLVRAGSDPLVVCGSPLPHNAVRIAVDGNEVPQGTVGRIEVRGTNVALKSLGRPLPITDDGWLDTEDLGFMSGGELVVCGRTKDLVFVLGQNVFLHDIDRIASRAAGTEAGSLAVSDDRVVVFVKGLSDVRRAAVTRALAVELGITVADVLPIDRLPKTPSGKLQRSLLPTPAPAPPPAPAPAPAPAPDPVPVPVPVPDPDPLARVARAIAQVAPAVVFDPDRPFLEMGLTSLSVTDMAHVLGIDPSVPFRASTPRALADNLSNSPHSLSPAPQLRLSAPTATPIAIIGLAACAAAADDVRALWSAVAENRDLVTALPPERLADLARAAAARGFVADAPPAGYRPDITLFDPRPHGLSDAESLVLHPEHRLLFDLLHDALADAGLGARDGARTGLWVGHIADLDGGAWLERIRRADPSRIGLALPGQLGAFMAGRPAHLLDLAGPAVVIDTACSASLAAVHAACSALRAGECERALVASARITLEPARWPVEFGFESRTGRSRPFGTDADGLALGEGGAAVVLEPLDQALAAGRRIWAVIAGSALGHDGRAARLGAPNPAAQAEVITRAWRMAGRDPADAAFIEAHGAGTPLGDRIEVAGLSAAGVGRTAKVPLTAIKSQVGHLFDAAGLLGLIKASVALSERVVPGTLQGASPLPELAAANLDVPTNLRRLGSGALVAGVTSLGFSGTSAHVVLASAPLTHARSLATAQPRPTRSPRRFWLEFPDIDKSVGTSPVAAPLPRPPQDIPAELRAILRRFSDVQVEGAAWGASFFALGLDSLVLIQLRQAIEAHFSVALPLQRLLEDLGTPAELAAWLESKPSRAPTPPAFAAASSSGRPPTPAAELSQPAQPAPELVKTLDEMQRRAKAFAHDHRPHLANNRWVAGFRPAWKELVYPPVARTAAGAYFEDVDGRRILDLSMGFGVFLFGHDPAFVRDAIRTTLDAGGHFLGPMSPLAGEVAARLTRLTRTDRVAFYNSGTEAVMVALRLARAVTGKTRIATFAGSYHGSHDQVLGVAGDDGNGIAFAPGIPEAFVRGTLVIDYGRPEALERIHRERQSLAAVLVEPIQSRRPDLQPKRFLAELAALCREHDIALIFDEVITGFRAAAGGVRERFGVDSDLVVYGKVVGGGMPIGVVAGRARFMDAIDGGAWSFGDDSRPRVPTTFVAGTFCQHPLALAAANAVLGHLESAGASLYTRLEEGAAALVSRLDKIFRDADVPIQVARFGSQMRFIARGDAELFFWEMLREGVWIWEGRTAFWSTAHGPEEAERIVTAAQRAIARLRVASLAWTPAQARALAAMPNDERSAASHQVVVLRLGGPLAVDALAARWDEVVRRHEALRARSSAEGLVLDALGAPLELHVGGLDAIERAIARPFATTRDEPLARAVLARDADEHLLAIILHRVVGDGWSLGLLVAELLTSRPVAAPTPLAVLSRALTAQVVPPAPAVHRWPFPSAAGGPPYRATIMTRKISTALVRRVAQRFATTPFGALLSVFGRGLLAASDAPDHVTIAVPIAGQPLLNLPNAVGQATRLAPLTLDRADITGDVKRQLTTMLAGACADVAGVTPRPSFVFNLDRVPDLSRLAFGITGTTWVTAPHRWTAYDLVVQALELPPTTAGGHILTEWKFAEHVDPHWVHGLADAFVAALEEFVI